MNSNYRVWVTFQDASGVRIKIAGDIMNWADIQRLLGEKLLECQSAEMTDANAYTFKGTYRSTGDEYLPMSYHINWSPA